ncbi:MAG: ATP-binding protein [Bacteroidales bacterium]|jgi:AAA+ ATPase superfamily predicted ATPase|nr:ATP-binding protein [Bacteroidales bacterium]MEE3390597.1 ATP-binding protein [Candidatus Cryptobacteroides sp.]MCH3940795.1 ATP-binding protein [Bacteroidales bacterium]MCI2135638.1 ATP-binding protein [Bacteroidales bacterium]MDY6377447.1 ATP-binding protein [Bacteroidales bacterium]
MSKLLVDNPFVIGKYISDDYFCDREKETEFLYKQIVNGRNVAMLSPRRMGKTGLIYHLFGQKEVAQRYHVFFTDIYATQTIEEFVYSLSSAIYVGQRKSLKKRFWDLVKSLRLAFRTDAVTGEPELSLSLGDIKEPEKTLDEIFEYLESADKPCIVAIDEFQQIGSYKGVRAEALLRTKIQQCRQTHFIFAGSKKHLMANMFNSPAKPFYQSVISIGINPLPKDAYVKFAISKFKEYGKEVEPELVGMVYDHFDGVTWFVQVIMNELFAMTGQGETCKTAKFDAAFQNAVDVQAVNYEQILSNLSLKQKALVQAIAKEGTVTGITRSGFIKKYNLDSSSTVQSALRPLVNNDIVLQDGNAYRLYDYFFASWLKR